ncbi:type I restriction endonuclease, partial [Timonella senegalensis]|uniref:type I restriction endonuclease n=1 Tax=Timonella senegalensis TaxID=1465825 RepID=UPI002FDCF5F6
MSFESAINEISAKVRAQRESIQTEEATKNAFVMPFISRVLGYDVFDPLEVVPEFTADHGMKKGEKVDYAIMRDGEVQILIECKHAGDALNVKHASQLFRYFSVTNARIGVLTNGHVFHFFTDLDAPNIMDSRPFLVLDLLDIDESILPELAKLRKDSFNLDSVVSSAEELKYVGALKREIGTFFREPDEEIVKLLMSRVSDRRRTADAVTQFSPLVEKALKQFLKEQVNDRLKTALGETDPSISFNEPNDNASEHPSNENAPIIDETRNSDIFTTEEELAGYQIIKAIACSEVKPQRVTHRDSKSYFAVLLDDNNRRGIARLHLNAKSKKYIGLFDEDRNEERFELEDLDDIYQYADRIRATVRSF